MKKVLSSILISFIIFVNLLTPFSVGWGKGGVEVKKNEVKAESSIIPLSVSSSSPLLRKTYVKINGIFSSVEKIDVKDLSVEYFISDNPNDVTTLKNFSGTQTGDAFDIREKNEDGKIVSYDYWFGRQIEQFANNKGTFDFENDKTYYVYVRAIRLNLKEPIDGENAVQIGASKVEQFVGGVASVTGDYYITDEGKAAFLEAKAEAIANGSTEEQAVIIAQKNVGNEKDGLYNNNNSGNMPPCGVKVLGMGSGSVTGCAAQLFYYVIFVPTSYLFALSGTFFDTTFAYSVQDTSYRSVFVVQGWGLVRDFCNIFFIFILLYVAIGTTLSLHSMKTKETIINVVIIGLFINFSLFATQLIIDASNITARVFYNADTIKLEEEGANGVANLTPGLTIRDDGVIPLSAGIVNKINPQNLILKSNEINNIPDKGKKGVEGDKGLGASSFILVVLLASAVNIVGFIVFLSVGMLFVVRIIGLWIAMILAPLAFFTYILPEEMAGIKMIGWKNWWPETLKLAFLAPVFIFFMYIILKFLSMDLISDIAGKAITKDGLGYFISILMPFAFIMVLLMKAKGIAKDMAGEMGEFATKMGSAVGGLALGAATGGTAMLMRGTLGRMGSSIANSDRLKASEARGGVGGFFAKNLRNVGTGASVASFDARNTKAGAAASKELGIDMGKAKEGGFVKARADNVAARVKRANELELSEDSALTQAVRQAEHALHAVKTDPDRQNAILSLNNGIPFTEVQEAIRLAQTNLTATQTARMALPTTALPGTAAAENIRLADLAVKEAQAALVSAKVADSGLGGLERAITTAERALGVEERKLKDAETALLAAKTPAQIQAAQIAVNNAKRDRNKAAAIRDDAKNNKEARETTIRAQERPIHIAEDALARSQNEVIRTNNHIRHDYAESIQGAWSNAINGVLTLGEHSALGEKEAHYKILAGAHEEKKTAEHH